MLGDGFRWLEGPVWFGDRECLLLSDMPNDRILSWTERSGVQVFRQPAGFPNGQTRDRQGRLITCSHHRRCVLRTELDGEITVLADRFAGKRLNSPNDVIVKSDGTVWFSDPPYGIQTDYEGASRSRSSRREFTVGTRGPVRSAWRPTILTGPTGSAFRPTNDAFISSRLESCSRIIRPDREGGRRNLARSFPCCLCRSSDQA